MTPSQLVAMDNVLFPEPALGWPERCAEIAAAGFPAVYAVLHPASLVLEADAARLRSSAEAAGLRFAAAYVNIDLAGPDQGEVLRRCLPELAGDARLEVSFKASAGCWEPQRAHDLACRRLENLLPAARQHGVRIAIYPHSFYPIETLAQAERLAAEFGDAVGVVFPLSHVYAVQTFERVVFDLERLVGRLASFNLCGCRRAGPPPARCQALPLGEGDVDYRCLLAALAAGGFAGDIVLQGQGWPGDCRAGLRRSRLLLEKAWPAVISP